MAPQSRTITTLIRESALLDVSTCGAAASIAQHTGSVNAGPINERIGKTKEELLFQVLLSANWEPKFLFPLAYFSLRTFYQLLYDRREAQMLEGENAALLSRHAEREAAARPDPA